MLSRKLSNRVVRLTVSPPPRYPLSVADRWFRSRLSLAVDLRGLVRGGASALRGLEFAAGGEFEERHGELRMALAPPGEGGSMGDDELRPLLKGAYCGGGGIRFLVCCTLTLLVMRRVVQVSR